MAGEEFVAVPVATGITCVVNEDKKHVGFVFRTPDETSVSPYRQPI